MQTDWDDAYANMAHIDGSEHYPEQWTKSAADYRLQLATSQLQKDIAYGSNPREVMDIVLPKAKPKGLAVFVHGGYWMRLDKSYWTDLAEGARARGWAVCMPSYSLTPVVTISHITKQIANAITQAAERVNGPVRLAGHSAGGHLVSRMICSDTTLNQELLHRIEHTLSISGLHDLRPLMKTNMNETLKLNEAEAVSESAALHSPAGCPALTAWVGGDERPEFIRQSKLIDIMWKGLGAYTECIVDGTHHHFSVIEDLKLADSPITNAFVGDG